MRKIAVLYLSLAFTLAACSGDAPNMEAKAGEGSVELAGYKLKSPEARGFVLHFGAEDGAFEMPLVLDTSTEDGKELDTTLADLDLNGVIEEHEKMARKHLSEGTAEYSMEIEAPVTSDNPELIILRTITSCHSYRSKNDPYQYIIGQNFYCTLHRTDDDDVRWSYQFHTHVGLGKEDEKRSYKVRHFYLGSPASLSLETKFDADKLTFEGTIQDRDKAGLLSVKCDGKKIRPHVKIIDPSGQTIVDKAMEFG